MKPPRFVPAPKIDPPSLRYGAAGNRSDEELLRRAQEFYEWMQRRRTIRDFSDRPVPREVIEYCIRAAGTAPSGANLQPWHFVAISDPAVKHEIRVAAQKRRGRILRTSRAESVAGSARSARNGFEQAVSRNCAVVNRGLRAAVSNFGGWNTFADLLRD